MKNFTLRPLRLGGAVFESTWEENHAQKDCCVWSGNFVSNNFPFSSSAAATDENPADRLPNDSVP